MAMYLRVMLMVVVWRRGGCGGMNEWLFMEGDDETARLKKWREEHET